MSHIGNFLPLYTEQLWAVTHSTRDKWVIPVRPVCDVREILLWCHWGLWFLLKMYISVITADAILTVLPESTRRAAVEAGSSAMTHCWAALSAAVRRQVYKKMNFYFYMTVILLKWWRRHKETSWILASLWLTTVVEDKYEWHYQYHRQPGNEVWIADVSLWNMINNNIKP